MKNKLGIVACSLFLAACALCVAAVLPMPDFVANAIDGNNECSCGDIVFGNDVLTNDYDYKEVSSSTSSDELYSESTLLTKNDFTLSGWNNAKYNSKSNSNKKKCAIMIGGNNNGHADGSFSITLNGYTCDKVIVYAAGWKGDNAADLNVDNCNKTYTLQTTSQYDFSKPLEFTFEKTNKIKLNNSNSNKTGTKSKGVKRVLVSKMVFRLYKDK